MKIDADTVRYLAGLAALEFSPEEVVRMQRDLDAILGYFDKLAQVDTASVQPTTHVMDIETPLRADEVRGVLPVDEVVRNAPDHTETAMVVPKVLE